MCADDALLNVVIKTEMQQILKLSIVYADDQAYALHIKKKV